jgi:DNA ligase (NAD+)
MPGFLAPKPIHVSARRPINLLCYQIVATDGDTPRSQFELLSYLKSIGFPVTDVVKRFDSLDKTIEYAESWKDKRDTLPFEADGVVIKLDDLDLQQALGVVGKDPRGAIALKFPAREATTTLLNLGINIGRTGIMAPYAILAPVNVGGVTIERATLHNFDDIARKDIRIGDRVCRQTVGRCHPAFLGRLSSRAPARKKSSGHPSSVHSAKHRRSGARAR